MAYITQNTTWMTEISPQIKELLIEFYRIGDLPDPEAGNLWAERVFTQDGCLVVGENRTSGEEGSWTYTPGIYVAEFCLAIRTSREKAWDLISARKHVISEVFAGGIRGRTVMLNGTMYATVRANGIEVGIPFAGKFIIDEDGPTIPIGPRVSVYEAWADQSPLREAMAKP
jgi:hypothetical protein